MATEQETIRTMTIPEIEERLRNFQFSKNFPRKMIFERHVLPIEETDTHITIVTAVPNQPAISSMLTYMLQKEILWVQADEKNLVKLIKDYYGVGADTLHAMMNQEEWQNTSTADQNDDDVDDAEASVVRFVSQVITEAHHERATDIHFEPQENSLRIRYRVDGVLHQVPLAADAKRFENAIISRIKVMSGMDIAERRLPQDGRLQVKVDGEDLDVRVSTIPTAHGESVSLRLLTRQSVVIGLDRVGFGLENQEIIKRIIKRPHGIILLTGPTGCGKSSTLYACLSEINREELRIITIEDPIEYKLAGVNQIQVRPEIDFDFAKGLRHVLRQDPDVIMVGEIRDYETAEIAIRSSLTGHLVFSTLHTNDAPGAITRLTDMGVEPFLVSSSLNLVIAQRLVRKVCPHCAHPAAVPPILSEEDLAFLNNKLPQLQFVIGTGCETCSGFGYLGRTAIHEFMVMSDSLVPLILSRASASDLRVQAMKEGMFTLKQDGLYKAAQGITTVEEVMRATEEGDF
jgi:type II secretory ATPase GspE/PulE/Tfp pilus assembly ATPase PilB-like protein